MNFSEVYAEVDVLNISSMKVVEKNGFKMVHKFLDENKNEKYLYKLEAVV